MSAMKSSRLAFSAFAAFATLAGAAPALASSEKPLPKDLPPFGADKPLPALDVTKSTLPEGLTLWIVKRPGLPKVTLAFVARGGTAADPQGLEGTAEVLAEALKGGTATRTSKAIAQDLQSVGGSLSTGATDDALTITVDGLSSGTSKLIEVVADVARNASFPAAEVALAKENALQGLLVRASTPEYLAEKAFGKAIYGDHPYHITGPSKEGLEAVTPEILKRERDSRVRPERSLLVVAGDLDPAAVAKSVGAAFAGWKATGEPAPLTPLAPGLKPRQIQMVNRPGSVQALLMVGRPAVLATDPDFFPLSVANTLFGGSFSSRLVANVREEKGYSYSPGSSLYRYQRGGLLRVRADVRNEVTAASLLEIGYEMDRMAATKPTDEELARAKRYQSGTYLLGSQVQGGVVSQLVRAWVLGLPAESLNDFVPKVNAVTAADVQRVGRTYFPFRLQTIVVVGDEAKIRSEVELTGPATTVTP